MDEFPFPSDKQAAFMVVTATPNGLCVIPCADDYEAIEAYNKPEACRVYMYSKTYHKWTLVNYKQPQNPYPDKTPSFWDWEKRHGELNAMP